MRGRDVWKSAGMNTHTTGLGEHHIIKTEQKKYYDVSSIENEWAQPVRLTSCK